MYADAETFLLRAVKLNPAYADAHYELGLLYEDRKQDAKAIHEYQLATKLRFDLSKAPCHPGRLYQKDGQPALAQKEFDAFEAFKANAAIRTTRSLRSATEFKPRPMRTTCT